MKALKNIYSLLVFLSLITACTKEDKKKPTENLTGFNNGVWVLNEGNFGAGNASIDFFHKDSKKTDLDVFKNVNGRPLGDVLQSMYFYEGKYYIVVNNSQKIEIADQGTFKNSASIFGFNSPRYFLPINSEKAYITDLYANGIWKYDLKNQQLNGKIDVSGWTEQMEYFNDNLFVTQVKRNKVLIIDIKTDKLLDSIQVGEEPQWILKDKEDKIWVLCNAYKKTLPATLHRIDPQTKQVLKTFSFPDQTHSPTRLCFNASKDTLFYLDKGVNKMSISDQSLPPAPFIAQKNGNYYGLGYDPRERILYVGDALDFSQPGFVFRYFADGTPIDSFKAGVNPGDFYFVD